MEYITAAEAAAKWGVTVRQVQRLLASERIPDAKKFGRSHLIPANAEKPSDLRFEKKRLPSNALLSDFTQMLPLLVIHTPRHDPQSVLNTIRDNRIKLICEGAFAYAQGDFARAGECYRKCEGNDAAKLCSSFYAIGAAICTGDYPFYVEIEAFLKNIINENLRADITAAAELSLAGAYIGAMAPQIAPEWIKSGTFSALPVQYKADAAYLRSKYFHCIGKYDSMLDVAQTTLAFYGSAEEVSSTDLYLRLMCAVACHSTDRKEESRQWLLDAMNIYVPYGIITHFVELMTSMGGLVEQLFEQEYPEWYDTAITQWKRTIPNWIKFHNRFTEDNITLILSIREYQMAQLAARGVPFKKIAEQLHVSPGTLNNNMQTIYQKLFINGKKELPQYIL
ncbi:MAG: LuxR C-terminal-related transcriptional regulator [Clostridiales bacterium]|nr:LuxR C-terminal-related transcriptional regulator [Clostridiales bacterium]